MGKTLTQAKEIIQEALESESIQTSATEGLQPNYQIAQTETKTDERNVHFPVTAPDGPVDTPELTLEQAVAPIAPTPEAPKASPKPPPPKLTPPPEAQPQPEAKPLPLGPLTTQNVAALGQAATATVKVAEILKDHNMEDLKKILEAKLQPEANSIKFHDYPSPTEFSAWKLYNRKLIPIRECLQSCPFSNGRTTSLRIVNKIIR